MPTSARARKGSPRGASRRGGRPSTGVTLSGLVAALGALVLVVGLVMLVQRIAAPTLPGAPTCTFTGQDGVVFDLSPEQSRHAAVIAAATTRRGLPTRAATVGIATAMQESKLRNLPGGDRDSLGLFQQRPSQGWGTREQILDPVYASDKFYEGLVKVRGWQDMPLTRAAQAVQRSGFPEAYAKHETEARLYGDALAGVRPESIGCRLKDAELAATAEQVRVRLQRETGLRATATDGAVVLESGSRRSAATAAAWAVASAQEFGITEVHLGARVWRRAPGDDALRWSPSGNEAKETAVRIALARR